MKRHRIDAPSLTTPLSGPPVHEDETDRTLQTQAIRSWLESSRWRTYAQAASLLVAVVALACFVHFRPLAAHRSNTNSQLSSGPAPTPDPVATSALDTAEPSVPDALAHSAAEPAQDPIAEPVPPASTPSAPVLDHAAVAQAEGELDAASRDRARAEHRAAQSARSLTAESTRAAVAAVQARKLAFQIRDPSTRLAQANARGAFLRGEREKLATELATLRAIPRPKAASILTKSPVARPAQTDEFHFELHNNRVAFIDLNRLIQITKTDAQLRIRMTDHANNITSKVGPVGAFSLAYELVRAMPGSVDDLMQHRRFFDFKGWEVVPEYDNRGESYETSRSPISEFNRAINRVNPERATITLWVYPDSFALFRQIRDDLTNRGFSVAARPLPKGMTIRGSPMGTQSAAQ